MDETRKEQILQQAKQFWDVGQPLETGKIIFEHIPREFRAQWSVEILKIAYSYFPPAKNIDAIIEFAENPNAKWNSEIKRQHLEARLIVDQAYPFFYALPISWSQLIFLLARTVGKVTYTAYWYPAPFDHSAGWEIAEILWQISQGIDDKKFIEKMWQILCNKSYILSDLLIMCHPVCPICYVSKNTAE